MKFPLMIEITRENFPREGRRPKILNFHTLAFDPLCNLSEQIKEIFYFLCIFNAFTFYKTINFFIPANKVLLYLHTQKTESRAAEPDECHSNEF